MRISEHPALGATPAGKAVTFFWRGQPVQGREGEPVGAALLALGVRTLRYSSSGAPRGLYCGIGHCFECRVTIDGVPGLRACLTPLRAGMAVEPEGSPEQEAAAHGG